MNGRSVAVRRAAVVAWGLVILAGGCAPYDDATAGRTRDSTVSAETRAARRPVLLPDLSRLADSSRKQMEEGYASLLRELERPGTTTVELGNAYGDLGRLFMAAAYFDAAESCFVNAQALAPNDVRWAYYLAQVYRTKNEPAKAAAFFERALQLRPNDIPALVYLGETYLADGRLDAAEPPLRKALSLEPRLAVALFGLGRAALARQDYAAAVQHLEKALALDPQASVIHYPLAMAHRGLGDQSKADAHLRERGNARTTFLPDPLMKALEELPSSAQAYEFKGNEALSKGEWNAAVQYFRKGVELAPDNPSLRLKMADALRRSGLAEASLPHYEQVVKIDPHLAEARFGYAMALVRLRRYEEARNHLTEGMNAFPNQPVFAQSLARLLAAAPDDRVRDGPRALAMIHELLKRQQSTDLGETMAMALAASGQYDEAVTLQRALLATAQRAGREDLARVMVANLKLYETRQPCRIPWTDDAMP